MSDALQAKYEDALRDGLRLRTLLGEAQSIIGEVSAALGEYEGDGGALARRLNEILASERIASRWPALGVNIPGEET